MTALDRDKARAVLVDEGWGIDTRATRLGTAVDRLAACVVPDPRVAAALALHQRVPYRADETLCRECRLPWPCATAGALGATS